MGGLLATIHGPADVQALDAARLPELCAEIRRVLVAFGHAHGGHIGSNLGMVEATVALHRVFDSPRDRIVFDVSHQCYTHKMLTGRAQAYLDPALHDAVTGFTNPRESVHDQFVLGHTGTSISLACGLAKMRDMRGGDERVVAVIGDGALSSAIAFEGLNNAAEQGGNMIIVVNDNEMSIAEDSGGMYATLARLRESDGAAGDNLFRAFGLDYRYVADGNDVAALVAAFEEVRDCDHPVVVHIHTHKGLGLPAVSPMTAAATGGEARLDGDAAVVAEDMDIREGRCEANHWQDPDSAAGRPLGARKHYGQLAMAALERRFADEPGLVVVSPATPGSNGITRAFRARAGAHYVDTGIAEEHAVAFASALAKAGGRPVLATSATFFQRTFDQLQQELSLNANPATLLDFGGGLSGADDTHSGAFDIVMFANIPGLTCLAPTGERMFLDMLAWATGPANERPVVIRVPGDPILAAERSGLLPAIGVGDDDGRSDDDPMPWSRYRTVHAGADVAILALGNTYPLGLQVVDALRRGMTAIADGDAAGASADAAVDATLVTPLCFSTLDEATLERLADSHRLVVTLEDGQLDGGWGQKVAAWYQNHRPDVRVRTVGGDTEFTDRVPLTDLNERYGLTVEQVVALVRDSLRG
ncbi:1-deoxy-D-xylulose-5-phosphate synthase [Bifidobacterium samirii]|uniref:1-deoxy-D-xylulose-5-phosphate synthase n=2 Tax=Bifidobacterium samirii TaxID=2306974 RepID=A0A430FVT3_9BIFI|nr:1-deoxy-D-xylulose-5-phosphate synthase [Bifidobacterium samirii]